MSNYPIWVPYNTWGAAYKTSDEQYPEVSLIIQNHPLDINLVVELDLTLVAPELALKWQNIHSDILLRSLHIHFVLSL